MAQSQPCLLVAVVDNDALHTSQNPMQNGSGPSYQQRSRQPAFKDTGRTHQRTEAHLGNSQHTEVPQRYSPQSSVATQPPRPPSVTLRPEVFVEDIPLDIQQESGAHQNVPEQTTLLPPLPTQMRCAAQPSLLANQVEDGAQQGAGPPLTDVLDRSNSQMNDSEHHRLALDDDSGFPEVDQQMPRVSLLDDIESEYGGQNYGQKLDKGKQLVGVPIPEPATGWFDIFATQNRHGETQDERRQTMVDTFAAPGMWMSIESSPPESEPQSPQMPASLFDLYPKVVTAKDSMFGVASHGTSDHCRIPLKGNVQDDLGCTNPFTQVANPVQDFQENIGHQDAQIVQGLLPSESGHCQLETHRDAALQTSQRVGGGTCSAFQLPPQQEGTQGSHQGLPTHLAKDVGLQQEQSGRQVGEGTQAVHLGVVTSKSTAKYPSEPKGDAQFSAAYERFQSSPQIQAPRLHRSEQQAQRIEMTVQENTRYYGQKIQGEHQEGHVEEGSFGQGQASSAMSVEILECTIVPESDQLQSKLLEQKFAQPGVVQSQLAPILNQSSPQTSTQKDRVAIMLQNEKGYLPTQQQLLSLSSCQQQKQKQLSIPQQIAMAYCRQSPSSDQPPILPKQENVSGQVGTYSTKQPPTSPNFNHKQSMHLSGPESFSKNLPWLGSNIVSNSGTDGDISVVYYRECTCRSKPTTVEGGILRQVDPQNRCDMHDP